MVYKVKYKSHLSELEKLNIDLWYNIVMIFRSVQWSRDSKVKDNKGYLLSVLADLMCELDLFQEAFEDNNDVYEHTHIKVLKKNIHELSINFSNVLEEHEYSSIFRNINNISNKIDIYEEMQKVVGHGK